MKLSNSRSLNAKLALVASRSPVIKCANPHTVPDLFKTSSLQSRLVDTGTRGKHIGFVRNFTMKPIKSKSWARFMNLDAMVLSSCAAFVAWFGWEHGRDVQKDLLGKTAPHVAKGCSDMIFEAGARSTVSNKFGQPNKTGRQKLEEHSEKLNTLNKVGSRVLGATDLHIRAKIDDATQRIFDQCKKEEKSREYFEDAVQNDEAVNFWIDVGRRCLEGEKKWNFVLIETNVPQAYVSSISPSCIHISTGLLEVIDSNHDELAMILSHEMAHILFDHSDKRGWHSVLFRGAELFLLKADPTSGWLSLAAVFFLSLTRDAAEETLSRQHEREADYTGCIIAARACYDAAKGIEVFRKLHELESHGRVAEGAISKVFRSHPPSLERYEELKKQIMCKRFLEGCAHCNSLKRQCCQKWAGFLAGSVV